MLVKVPRGWEIPERLATDESTFLDRRRFLGALGAGAALAATAAFGQEKKPASTSPKAPRNDRYRLDRPLTDEQVAARHNVFDEFSVERSRIWQLARDFRTTPWKIHIGGAVEKHLAIDVADLLKQLGTEERLYRHRCVEAWAMAVPWTGIPLAKFVELARPTSKANYLRMVSFADPSQAPGWYASKRVFPYYEALTLAEATNELAFLATGIYGHPLPPQHGAPIRLVVPWKYGLKSIKSIVAFQFTQNQPGTMWNDLSPGNYSFLSNVDPTATHPWPQNEETMLGTDEKRKTLPYNGYGEFVAKLYS
jgi:sulfoxide reductase catalytic subunit YedY